MNQSQHDAGGLKLQINSLAAMERLLGGDSAMEIELRRSVVAAFVAEHLGTLVKEAMNANLAGFNTKVKDEVKRLTMANTGRWSNDSVTLSDDVKKLIKTEVDRLVAAQVQSAVSEPVENLKKRIPAEVERLWNADYERRVNAGVKERLEQLRQLLPVSEHESRKITVSP